MDESEEKNFIDFFFTFFEREINLSAILLTPLTDWSKLNVQVAQVLHVFKDKGRKI